MSEPKAIQFISSWQKVMQFVSSWSTAGFDLFEVCLNHFLLLSAHFLFVFHQILSQLCWHIEIFFLFYLSFYHKVSIFNFFSLLGFVSTSYFFLEKLLDFYKRNVLNMVFCLDWIIQSNSIEVSWICHKDCFIASETSVRILSLVFFHTTRLSLNFSSF